MPNRPAVPRRFSVATVIATKLELEPTVWLWPATQQMKRRGDINARMVGALIRIVMECGTSMEEKKI